MTTPSDDDLVKGESFVKVDCGILDSSLYEHSARDQRSVFLTSLFMAKPFELTTPMPQLAIREIVPTGWSVPPGWYGIVRASAVGIIQRDGIEKEAGYGALEALGAPDQDSRSQAFEGRRMVRVDGGYVILNYFTYRDRDYGSAERMRRLRGRRKAEKELFDTEDVTGVVTSDVTVTDSIEHRAEAELTTEQNRAVDSIASETPTPSTLVIADNGARPLPVIRGTRNVVAIRDRLAAVIAELQTGTRARLKKEQIRTLQAEMLFGYWQAKFNKPRAGMDDKREKLLVRRLEENRGDVSELFYVLDGALTDDWVTGKAQNARHANDGIEYIFRDRAHVERFASLCRGYRANEPHKMAVKYAAIFTGESDAK